MANIAEEHQEYSQRNISPPIDENAPLECNFDGCSEKNVFPNRSALKYFFPYSYTRLVLTFLQKAQRQARPAIHMRPPVMPSQKLRRQRRF